LPDYPPKIEVIVKKFGAEGAQTTSTTYVVIADSDIAFDPQALRKAMPNQKLYAKFVYHIGNNGAYTTYIQVYRQNAGTAVAGSEASKAFAAAGWAIVSTGWIDFTNEAEESFQLQMKVSAGTGEFNSALMILSNIPF
jgi:hypothetical protein